MRLDLIAVSPKHWYEPDMDEFLGEPGFKCVVLQDQKRLPARFFARISGAPICRLP